MLLFTNHLALRRAGIAKSEILNLSVRIIVSLSCQEEFSTDEYVRPWLLDIDFVSREVYAVWYNCVLIKVVFLTPAIKIMMEVEKVQALSPTDKLSVMITTEARSVSFADFWIWFSICKLQFANYLIQPFYWPKLVSSIHRSLASSTSLNLQRKHSSWLSLYELKTNHRNDEIAKICKFQINCCKICVFNC